MADASEGGDVNESIYIDAFGDRPPLPFCACAAPKTRIQLDGSGRVCTQCGIAKRDPQMCNTFYDIVRTRAFRATPGPAARPPFDIDVALQFMFSEATRSRIYDHAIQTTRRVVDDDTRHVFDKVGVEYMLLATSPTYSQRALLMRCLYEHCRYLTATDAIAALVDMICTLPIGPWRGVVRSPWMCARLYPDTERDELRKLLHDYLHRPRAEARNDPGVRICNTAAMHTRRTAHGAKTEGDDTEDGFHTRLVVVPLDTDPRSVRKRELRASGAVKVKDEPTNEDEDEDEPTSDNEETPVARPVVQRQSRAWDVLCRGLKKRAAPGGRTECASTSAYGRKARAPP